MALPNYYINGQAGGAVDPGDRGLTYGDGLFETMLCRSGTIQWLDEHLDRLELGCNRLAIPLPQRTCLAAEVGERLPREGEWVVKLVVTRGVGPRGYSVPEASNSTRIVSISPWSGYPTEHYTDGVALEICTMRAAENPQLAGLKHLCRLEQVLAQMELNGREADEGVLLDRSGCVVGGITSNLFAFAGGRLVTPSLLRCGVHGVMRRIVLRQAVEAGLASMECELSLDELQNSDELFITNAVAEIRPVRRLGRKNFAVGDRTRALMRRLNVIPESTAIRRSS